MQFKQMFVTAVCVLFLLKTHQINAVFNPKNRFFSCRDLKCSLVSLKKPFCDQADRFPQD